MPLKMTDPHRAWERAVGCAICTMFTYSIICWKIYRFCWRGGTFYLGTFHREKIPQESVQRKFYADRGKGG